MCTWHRARKVLKFNAEGKLGRRNSKELEPGEKVPLEGEKVIGVAVDAKGNLWVDFAEEENEEGYVATSPTKSRTN